MELLQAETGALVAERDRIRVALAASVPSQVLLLCCRRAVVLCCGVPLRRIGCPVNVVLQCMRLAMAGVVHAAALSC